MFLRTLSRQQRSKMLNTEAVSSGRTKFKVEKICSSLILQGELRVARFDAPILMDPKDKARALNGVHIRK